MACFYDVSGWNCNRASVVLRGVISMAKHKKKKKPEIRIYFKDGKTDIIPQKFWDDYEVNGNLFVVKKLIV